MHRMQSGGWPYSEVGRDSSKTPSLRVAVLHAAVFRSLRSNRNRRACMHALIVMPRPLSVSQETIIIVLYYSVQSEVSAVRKPESPLVGSFFFVQ